MTLSVVPCTFISITDPIQIICVFIFYRSEYVDLKKVNKDDHQRIRMIQSSVNLKNKVCAEAAERFSMSNSENSDKLKNITSKAAERGSEMLVTDKHNSSTASALLRKLQYSLHQKFEIN